ncbi:MAG: hypothetical protein MI922_11690, partial [Bacteroidales bacterium]|nr:hypothetical protein [Bacteroidales bacterium]
MKRGNDKRNTNSKPTSHRYIISVIKFISLMLALVLATSHESANPKIGNTKVDFYTAEFKQGIQKLLIQDQYVVKDQDDSVGNYLNKMILNFYVRRDYLPAWTINFSATNRYKQVDSLLTQAAYYGLNKEVYLTKEINHFKHSMQNGSVDSEKISSRVKLEIEITKSIYLYAIHLKRGLNNISATADCIEYLNFLPQYINKAVEDNNLEQQLLALQPQLPQYRQLQKALENYAEYTILNEDLITVSRKSSDEEIFESLKQKKILNDTAVFSKEKVEHGIKKLQRLFALKETGKLNSR